MPKECIKALTPLLVARTFLNDKVIEFYTGYSPRFSLENIFNADETGWFYKQLPPKTLMTKVMRSFIG